MDWTITLGATTQTLAAWGVSGLVRERRNQEPDILAFTLDGHALTSDSPFAADDVITLKYGTTIWFVGRCKTPSKAASGGNEGLRITAENVWGELQRRAFLQSAQQYTGLSGGSETYATYYTSHCILFASANVTYDPDLDGKATMGAVIQEVLDYAISGGASVQYDSDELDALTIIGPATPMTDPRCADAIREVLRWCPDCVVWFDYTTSPATIHFTPRAEMGTQTLAIGDAADGVTAVQLTPRDDLAVPFVYIKYEQTNNEDGKSWISIAPAGGSYAGDLWPTSAYPSGLGALDGLVLTIDLQGTTTSTVRGIINSAALPSGTSPSSDWLDWLKGRAPWLTRSEITALTLDTLSFSDTPLAYELLPGSGGVAEWMRTGGGAAADAVEVTVKCRCGITIAGGITVQRDVDVRITTTNLSAGTYSLRSLDDGGEPVPTGLAHYLYDQMATGHWEGQVTTEAAECPGTLRPGQLLRVTGGDDAWATMDAVIHSTSEDVGSGRTVVSVGPNKWLAAGEIMGWLKSQREKTNRGGKRSWNTLSTGLAASGLGAVDLPNSNPVDAPSGGVPDYDSLSLRKLNTGATTVDTAKGQIILNRAHACDGSSTNGKLVQIRQLKCSVKDLAGTTKTRLLVMASDGYDSSIHGSELELVAGGGSEIKAYKVQAGGEHDDYLTVKEWASGAETGSTLSIAKPPYLRIASKPSASHTIKPAYATGTVVYGTTVSGGTDVGLTIMDLNVDARKWAHEIRFCEGGVAKKADADMGAVTTV